MDRCAQLDTVQKAWEGSFSYPRQTGSALTLTTLPKALMLKIMEEYLRTQENAQMTVSHAFVHIVKDQLWPRLFQSQCPDNGLFTALLNGHDAGRDLSTVLLNLFRRRLLGREPWKLAARLKDWNERIEARLIKGLSGYSNVPLSQGIAWPVLSLTNEKEYGILISDVKGNKISLEIKDLDFCPSLISDFPDGGLIAVSSRCTVQAWRSDGTFLDGVTCPRMEASYITCLCGFQHNDALVGTSDGSVFHWKPGLGISLHGKHVSSVTQVIGLSEGHSVTGHMDGCVMWRNVKGQVIASFDQEQDSVTAIAALPGGCAVGYSYGAVHLFNEMGAHIRAPRKVWDGAVTCLAALPGKRLAVATSNVNQLAIHILGGNQTLLATLEENNNNDTFQLVQAIRCQSDGQILAHLSDGTISVWEPDLHSLMP